MVANGIVDEQAYRQRNADFYQDYQRGCLDNDSYLAFALEPLTHYSIEELHAWRADYVDKWIKPLVAPGTASLLDKHRERGDELIIISATHLFVSEPIGSLVGISTVLSTAPEIIDNRYTGRFLGTPTYKEGKVTVLREWAQTNGHVLDGCYFYSDSLNDLALLEVVDNPVAVTPDAALKRIAEDRNWPIIDLG
jgi:HAD superfamily hydrolase (TIGR01490 family)